MEDVSKALLIAAGMFFIILILSSLVIFHNDISTYFTQKHDDVIIKQTQELNAKFENYHRNNIRGSDLISLMNRVIDYNATESYFEGTNYKRIRVNIHIGAENLDEFKYELENSRFGTTNNFITADITNTTGGGDNYANDRQLVAITGTSSNLISRAVEKGFNITDTQLQQLQSQISNIIVDESGEDMRAIENRYYRANILEDLIGWRDIQVDEETWKSKGDSITKMELIKEIASQYYQYIQFKRACFDCTEVIYDDETNRVVEMNFVLQTKNGSVVFD